MLAIAGLSVGSVRIAAVPGLSGCGTVDLLVGLQTGTVARHDAGWSVAGGGPEPALRTITTADGLFNLHYAAPGVVGRFRLEDGRNRGLPSAVLRVEQVLAAARILLVDQGGWEDPSPVRPLDVYLVTGEGSGRSRAVPEVDPASSLGEGVSSFMVLSGSPASWSEQAVHQYLHILQFRQSASEETWLYEASALATEARLSGLEPAVGAVEALLSLPVGHAFLGADGPVHATAALFLGHVAAAHGDGVLAELWRQAGRRYGPEGLGALDTALRLTDLTTFAEAWRGFTLWLAYPDAASRPDLPGRLVEAVPPAPVALQVSGLPAGGLDNKPLFVEPSGVVFIHLGALDDVGAVRLELEVSPDAKVSADVLVSWKHVPLGWMVTPVTIAAGRGVIDVPMAPGSRSVLVVRNEDAPGGTVAGLRFAASAEPTYPFDLAFLAADASPGRVEVSWGTETESSMYGWVIYRATKPVGTFRPVTRLPLPSRGDSDAPLAYQFTDTNVVAGTRYYYLVEGITIDGLARRSAAVATRAAPLR